MYSIDPRMILAIHDRNSNKKKAELIHSAIRRHLLCTIIIHNAQIIT